jgi:O-antigen ligase
MKRGRWLLLLPIAAIFLFIYLPPDELIARFADIATPKQWSAQDRLEIWRETLPMIPDYAATGAGLGGYESAFMRYKRSLPMVTDNAAHNDYLQYLVELGLPGWTLGLVLVLSFVVTASKAVVRHTSPAGRALAIACLASMLALLIHSTVDFNSYVPANAFAFAWIAGIAVSVMFSSKPVHGSAGTILEAKAISIS